MKPILYTPRYLWKPPRLLDVPSAWKGIEVILHDLISRFCPSATTVLDIGVDYGYSTAAFANLVPVVVGVDNFKGDDPHAGTREDGMYERVRTTMLAFPNVRLVQSGYEDFFYSGDRRADITHIDIVHTYEDTYKAGILAKSPVILFHDTRSFPDVMRAVEDLADMRCRTFYEWPECHGLGILV